MGDQEPTLADVIARLDQQDRRFDAIDQRFDAIDQRFDAIDQRFDAIDQRFAATDRRFDDLTAVVERGFRDLAVLVVQHGNTQDSILQAAVRNLDERVSALEAAL